ncbi:phosphotransferase family protein [Kitasatospora cathayae]|uniref:Aminoglycoside phosphotransferase family protein n=1 Tax=Kitasatospora cathayae TaxID=3004092 RepID=A0ABY7PYN1_9ACTN|nr:aminoglycoside phosphotransferase family protein [Kitasatospora sp. HUAS 3-15]WBP85312.1 aminoglycoside phosphotransferase family protein [Kitasatospora sp. HUAS 3-15]
MQRASSRTVTVDLTYGDEYFGQVGPFEVALGWWSAVDGVVARVTELAGVPVLVTRLVDGHSDDPGHGGRVRYHAEALQRPTALDPRPPAGETVARLAPAARRAAWATPEGLRAALTWAQARLAAVGRPAAAARQIRTWNLSALFRFPTATGTDAWLKTTSPRFTAAEGEVIGLLGGVDPSLVPTVLAADPAHGWLLLDHVPGEDGWSPSPGTVADVVPRFVAAQAALAERPAALAGLRDRTPAALHTQLVALLDRLPVETDLTAEELDRLREFAVGLPALLAELAACGLPETLLHGDFHPGNWRTNDGSPVVVDYADACLGHPALDGLRPRAYLTAEAWRHHAGVWTAAWRRHAPGSDPQRALHLAEPLYHLSYALRYQEFLDHIEPSERPYHEGDPAAELRAVLACGRRAGRELPGQEVSTR